MSIQLSANTEQQLRHLAVSLHMQPEQVLESMVDTLLANNQAAHAGPQSLVGTCRSLGAVGPVYEVMSIADHGARARLVETGEEFDYTLDEILNDPVAQ
jgi:hypothetical protein